MPTLSVDDTLRSMLEEYRGAFAAQSFERRRQRRQLVETTMDHLRRCTPHPPGAAAQPSTVCALTLPAAHVSLDGTSAPLPMPDVLAGSIVNNPRLSANAQHVSKEEIMQRLALVYQGCSGPGGETKQLSPPQSNPSRTSAATGKAELMETLRKLYAS